MTTRNKGLVVNWATDTKPLTADGHMTDDVT